MTALDERPRVTGTPPGPPLPQERRRIGGHRASDWFAVIGALLAAAATTGVLWTEVSLFTGAVGYVIVTWLVFVLLYALLVSFDEDGPAVRDRVATVVVSSLGLVLLAAVVFVVVYTVVKAWHALWHLNFYTQDLGRTLATDPLTKGGVLHAIVGTLIEVGIALTVSVPLGLLAAVFLHQVPGRFSRFVRTIVGAMTALPDIIAGLFIYATLILTLGLDRSGLAAATALAITVLPIVIRAADVVLRLVPGSLTEASYALGSGQWRTVWHVLLPTARSGLVTAVILGAARAVGETSPVLLTAGATPFLNVDPVHEPMASLPLQAFLGTRDQSANEVARGFGAAVVLLVLVLVLFIVARILGGRAPGDLTARQRRRRATRSRRDADRIAARGAATSVGSMQGEQPW